MAKLNITIGKQRGVAPTVDDSTVDLIEMSYIFQVEDFTNNFQDVDGDSYKKIVITSLPDIGTLTYLESAVQVGQVINLNNISSLVYNFHPGHIIQNGNIYSFHSTSITQLLTSYYNMYNYVLDEVSEGYLHFSNPDTDQSVSITRSPLSDSICVGFKVSDDSANEYFSNNATVCFNTNTDLNIPEIYVNNPPTIGNNTISTFYNIDIIFTRQHFVEDTNPAYSDPEGDQPYKLKIMSLPSNGLLLLNEIPVQIGDELLFEGDISSGNFIYRPDNSTTDIDNVNFQFQVNDTGSQQFVE